MRSWARGRNYDGVLALCESCAVRAECLAAALADPNLLGLWGGTTGTERRALRRGAVA
jgi:WhiB family transcriptional regulator, redox-sensing transcriptional regulator